MRDPQWRKMRDGVKSQCRKGVRASDPTISEEEGAPPMVEVEMGTNLGVGMAADGGDEDGHHEGDGEDEWIDRGGETHH